MAAKTISYNQQPVTAAMLRTITFARGVGGPGSVAVSATYEQQDEAGVVRGIDTHEGSTTVSVALKDAFINGVLAAINAKEGT